MELISFAKTVNCLDEAVGIDPEISGKNLLKSASGKVLVVDRVCLQCAPLRLSPSK